jgi:dienelactone hydrolase
MKMSFVFLLLTTLVSCGHFSKTKNKENTYSPIVRFSSEGKNFEAKVNLPKDFKDKIPLVVIIHEWWGRNAYVQTRSEMLNKEGYATLVVDLFGDNKVAETPSDAQTLATPFYQKPEAGINLLNTYINLAKEDPHIDSTKIYVIGYCFGGTQALNLARSGSELSGVVSFHGGLASTMTSQGIKTRILAINGLADPMVPAKERARFEKEMKSLKANYEMVNYKGATHAFTNPKSTEVGKKYNIPISYNKKADEASWKELLKFLK